LLLLVGCLDGPAPPPPEAPPGAFDRPQALVWVDDLIVVGNSGFRSAGWRDGTLTVLDAATGEILRRLPTSAPNPQRLAVHDGWLYAVSSGPLDTAADPPIATGPGALDGWPVVGLRRAGAPALSVALETAEGGQVGGPVDLAFLPGGRALISLAVRNAALLVDLGEGRLLRDARDPLTLGDSARLGLGALAPWGARAVLVDFNTDRLHLFERDGTPWACSVALGERPRDLEGAAAPAVVDDTLYVLLTLPGVVRRVDLAALDPDAEDCGAPEVDTVVSPLGQVPNDLHVRGDLLYVVHSGDNRVSAYDRHSGAPRDHWVLPVGSNPWHLAFSPSGARMAVTEWAGDALTIFEIADPETSARVGAEAPAAPLAVSPSPGPGQAAHADLVVHAAGGDPPFDDPQRAVNQVRGAGERAGGTDVFSLDPEEGVLVLRWSERRLRNGPGADLVVFENGFRHPEGWFIDPLIVEVSVDGERWVPFPHDYRAPDERVFHSAPDAWRGFAGRWPVGLNADTRPVDPFGPAAGGDAFDLDDLGPGPEADAVRREGLRFVRLVPATARTNPDTGAPYPADPVSDGPDVDGIYGRYLETDDGAGSVGAL
jgi:hypothetical protein